MMYRCMVFPDDCECVCIVLRSKSESIYSRHLFVRIIQLYPILDRGHAWTHDTLADYVSMRGRAAEVPAQGANAGDEVPAQWRGSGGGVAPTRIR